jgi:hypothetical protein
MALGTKAAWTRRHRFHTGRGPWHTSQRPLTVPPRRAPEALLPQGGLSQVGRAARFAWPVRSDAVRADGTILITTGVICRALDPRSCRLTSLLPTAVAWFLTTDLILAQGGGSFVM